MFFKRALFACNARSLLCGPVLGIGSGLTSSKYIARSLTSSSPRFKYATAKFTKVVHPADTQMLNKVQGGLMLMMLESAADIAATKHCLEFGVKTASGKVPHPALVGVERVEMLGTAGIGDLMEFVAEIVHVRSRSLRISVDVYYRLFADMNAERKLMTRALLWYVPMFPDGTIGHFSDLSRKGQDDGEVRMTEEVKKREPMQQTFMDQSMQMYLGNLERRKDEKVVQNVNRLIGDLLAKPEIDMAVTMYPITPSHCSVLGHCRAGEILRWIDEFAATSSYKHTKRIMVTGSLDTCIITKPIPPGSCITFLSRPVFSSNRTVDIQVVGCMENEHLEKPTVFVSSFFTFVALRTGADDNFILEPLKPSTDEEKEVYEERKAIYMARKMLIEKMKAKKSIK